MIALLPFTHADYDRLISWIPDAEMLMQLAGTHLQFPVTAEQLDISYADTNRTPYKLLHMADHTIIGHGEIVLEDPTSVLLSRIFIGNSAYRGKGLGSLLVDALLQLSFDMPGVETASLNVFDWNVPAIRTYEKAGFRLNPGKTLTRHIKGETWIAVNMVIDKATWQQRKKNSKPHQPTQL